MTASSAHGTGRDIVKTPLRLLLTCAAGLFAASMAQAQAPSGQSPAAAVPDKPGMVYADRTRMTATVAAVDKNKRTVTLKGTDGRTVTLKAPPQAQNFDQIQVGDKVAAEYLDAVAIFVRKSDAPPQGGESRTVGVAPKGEMPAAMMVDTVEVTAKVEEIDRASRTVTLRLPDGSRRVVKVDDQVRKLDEVKPGDEVVVRHTEAVALTFNR
jgi:hypothetical protein